ncbi:alpha/beta fold hydrolase [Lacticaseibacillus thailandensis]|uniref:Alpha beta superfamily hydrolase n=1 Tax=Lacticaseibacillus thailandensis DSM 22698 = JCM 13996 TaxID=1423810 RepID=A0A0R2C743_9LACO|nr:alpha/beta hydrolase [Lacticaseibacillus thailandensis]KRM87194.1 Alpha beta superfamily hydrolase [Lacticaseibacillus thailandensis DSM 22698 = JCM 13996]
MYLTVNHTTLYYTQHGHGHPLILLHGNGTSHAIFADLIPQLAPNFTVYALDARDHGQSSTTDYISYQLMATDVRDFIQTLNLRAPTVIGVGDGGISALLVASAHPTIIGRLILAGVHTQPRDLRLRKRIALAADYFSRPRKKLGLQMWGPHITNEQLARVSAPTLILAGAQGDIHLRAARHLAAGIPDAHLRLVAHANHMSYIEDTDRFYSLIHAFLQA